MSNEECRMTKGFDERTEWTGPRRSLSSCGYRVFSGILSSRGSSSCGYRVFTGTLSSRGLTSCGYSVFSGILNSRGLTTRGAHQALHTSQSLLPTAHCPLPTLPRPALTLIELLVVIVILTTLVAAAIPVLAPATGERRIREGARQLNTTITAAQARAIELGRPVGIWLERLSVETNRPEDRGAVTTVYYAEEPAPFRGFSPDSAAILHPIGLTPNSTTWVVQFIRERIDPVNPVNTYALESLPPGMVRQFDRLEVSGVVFRLIDGDPNKMETSGPFRGYYKATTQPIRCQIVSGDFNPNPTFVSPHSILTGGWTYPKPYTIHRQPVRSSSDPLQLPDGIVVDLEGSGDHSGLGGFFHDPKRPYPDVPPVIPNNNDEPVKIMFGADGALSRVYRMAGLPPPVNLTATNQSRPQDYIPQSSIHLLVARRENVNESVNVSATTAFSDDNRANWFNKQSIWVSINPRTGRVATNNNTPVDETFFNPNSAAYGTSWPLLYKQFVFQRYAAREFARDSQTLGGR